LRCIRNVAKAPLQSGAKAPLQSGAKAPLQSGAKAPLQSGAKARALQSPAGIFSQKDVGRSMAPA